MIKLRINWKKGDIQIRSHGGAWHLTGFCLQILLRVSIFCLSLQLGRFWQPALLPTGSWGCVGMGTWKAAVKQGKLSFSFQGLSLWTIWFWEGKRKNDTPLTSDTLLILWPGKERSGQLILKPVCHCKDTLMTGTVLQGLLSLRLLYTSAAFKRSCSAGEDWRERVSGPIHGVAWGEQDPVKS